NGATGTIQNATGNDFPSSRAVIGNATVSAMSNVTGIWNGAINPINTSAGLSIDKGNFATSVIDSTDYSVFGDDNGNGTSTSDLPSDAPSNAERTDRQWYFSTVGTPRFDVYANLDDAAGSGTALSSSEPAANYALLKRAGLTGDFIAVSSASTVTAGVVIFDDVVLTDGYYAVAVGDGAWNTTGIATSGVKDKLFTIYPNPNNGDFTVEVNDTENAQLKITNALGQLVYTEKITQGNSRISMSNLAKGTYTISVEKGGKQSFEKLIVL
ncbi:MAG: T9SS type A sorting domain-containing protein, partial [Flavobacteriales bacterium]|nr:T9SS type A sorting domain-containing protein [Flavobacteriales bacterium]